MSTAIDPNPAPPSSHYLADWYGQPASLIRSAHALEEQWGAIREAGLWLRQCNMVLIAGIGSSYHASLALEAFLAAHGHIAKAIDAAELLYLHPLPPDTGVIIASRSGESIEIVKLTERCRSLNIPIAAITNTPDSTLAHNARSVVDLRTDFDHLISLRMYTGLVQGLLALGTAMHDPDASMPIAMLVEAWEAVAARLDTWHRTIHTSNFFGSGLVYYALGRGGSLASAYEARLLMEECGKTGTAALTTGGFRHGPQEAIDTRFRGLLWLPHHPQLRTNDLDLATSIVQHGARCLVVGQDLASLGQEIVGLEIPTIAPDYQPIIDIVPLQIGAYEQAMLTGKDPDTFTICPYVIQTEGGL